MLCLCVGINDEDSDDEGIGEILDGSEEEHEVAAATNNTEGDTGKKKKKHKKKKKPRTSSLERPNK